MYMYDIDSGTHIISIPNTCMHDSYNVMCSSQMICYHFAIMKLFPWLHTGSTSIMTPGEFLGGLKNLKPLVQT